MDMFFCLWLCIAYFWSAILASWSFGLSFLASWSFGLNVWSRFLFVFWPLYLQKRPKYKLGKRPNIEAKRPRGQLILLIYLCCWCADAADVAYDADALMLLMRWCCWYYWWTNTVDAAVVIGRYGYKSSFGANKSNWWKHCRICRIIYALTEQTAQSRKANSSIMLNPSARDTQILSVGKILHFLEYCSVRNKTKSCTKVSCSVSYWWYNSCCCCLRHLFNLVGQRHLIKVWEGKWCQFKQQSSSHRKSIDSVCPHLQLKSFPVS